MIVIDTLINRIEEILCLRGFFNGKKAYEKLCLFSGFNRELKIKTKLRCPFKEAIIVATTPKQEQNKYKTVIVGGTN